MTNSRKFRRLDTDTKWPLASKYKLFMCVRVCVLYYMAVKLIHVLSLMEFENINRSQQFFFHHFILLNQEWDQRDENITQDQKFRVF